MNNFKSFLGKVSQFFLDEKLKLILEKAVISSAIVLYVLHLLFILIVDLKLFEINLFKDLTISPISAIYTPFSIILIYEVYLLVYYLPKSITNYIGKQSLVGD